MSRAGSAEDLDAVSEQHRINGSKGGRPPGPANLREAHPLFLWEEGERILPIGWINVRRYSATGPTDAPRVWPASELMSEDDVFALFGGGSYELLGRNSLPNGQPGQVIRRRRLMLEGPPKPFTGEQPQAAQPAAGAAGQAASSTGLDLMIALMREDRREAMQREERRDAEMRAAEDRREAREVQRSQATMQLVTGALTAVAPILQAIITRPAPVAAPSTTDALMPLVSSVLTNKLGENPLENIRKVLELAKELKPEAPPQKTESLPELLEGFGQAAAGIAQLEQMRIEAAKTGALPAPPQMPGAPPPPSLPQNGQTIPAPGPPPGMVEESAAASLDSARLPS